VSSIESVGSFNPPGLWALVALPAIALMYWHRPRNRLRRVAGLFLWAEVAQEAGQQVHSQKRITTVAWLDFAAAVLLVALASGLLTPEVESDGTIAYWSGVTGRFLLCFAVATLLVVAWRAGPKSAAE
jgi:hypothetical protein